MQLKISPNQLKYYMRAISITLLGFFAAMGISGCAAIYPPTAAESFPVNYLEVSDRLVTSGRPSTALISALKPHQFQLVIDLAPTDGDSGFRNEAYLLGKKGIAYVAIPVEMQQPQYQDFALFSDIVNSAADGPVWIHCRINNRASMFTFLYRVIHAGSDPDSAYEKVTAIWVPAPHWLKFARETLARHNIIYDF